MTNLRKAEIYGRLQAIADLLDVTISDLSGDDDLESEIKIELDEFADYTLGYRINELYSELESIKEKGNDQT
jgi:hypothetical protein